MAGLTQLRRMAVNSVLLLSDLHLPPNASPYREAFSRFINGPAQDSAAVYILGDLFEAWIGDDAGLVDYSQECAHLAKLTTHGIPVFLQRGNRDFLIGKRFIAETGVNLLPEYACIDLPVGRTLLAHGDGFCTDDITFQRFRYWTRNPLIQAAFLRLPVNVRKHIRNRLRHAGDRKRGGETPMEMDVSECAVVSMANQYRVNRVIHGHTHRPGRYLTGTKEVKLERVVLPDWRPGKMHYLICDQFGLRTQSVP